MANLVIVESPTKASTIKGYLGSNYKVLASKGHVRDLPKSTLGIDVENNFNAKYIKIFACKTYSYLVFVFVNTYFYVSS